MDNAGHMEKVPAFEYPLKSFTLESFTGSTIRQRLQGDPTPLRAGRGTDNNVMKGTMALASRAWISWPTFTRERRCRICRLAPPNIRHLGGPAGPAEHGNVRQGGLQDFSGFLYQDA
ncbi:hypothetical protein [Rhizobium terrae]|uniref:hypothetical protein n=1 Tax=Rhizobium terrae TaxID=2171756 RepID=UPI0013C33B2F|nr:hypothetical protein [Rhizobium terrae]